MAECRYSSVRNEDLYPSMEDEPFSQLRRNSRLIEGLIKRYILNPRTVFDDGRLKRVAFGEKDESKPHKTILLVGETGVGKSTVINAVVNYMLGVESEGQIWFEITETKENQTDSDTKAVTVYDVFTEHSPFSLTIIDTPGFGSTAGIQEDLTVSESLHELFRPKDGVQEINAVCLVVTSHTSRLTDRQLYVFDAVLSLFGYDVEKNIVVFITHSQNNSKNAMKAIKRAKVACAKTPEGEPVCFKFNNVHCENFDDEDVLKNYQESWDLLNTTMESFWTFLKEIKTISVRMTLAVLRNRKQLTASIFNLKDQITLTELKQNELKQTKETLQKCEEIKGEMNNFQYETDEPYKEKVPTERKWWQFGNKEATCCTVCKENCHYPGCWWVKDLSWCSVMSEYKCTVCTGRCHYTDHVKEGKIYVAKTRRVTKTLEDLKKKYDTTSGEIKILISRIENEIKEEEKEKVQLLKECYENVESLEKVALKTDSVFTLQYVDFLIEKLKEIGKTNQVQNLEEMKKCAERAKVTQWFRAMQGSNV